MTDLQDDLFAALVRAERAERNAKVWREKWEAADSLAKKRGGQLQKLRRELRATTDEGSK